MLIYYVQSLLFLAVYTDEKYNSFIIVFVFTPSAIKKPLPIKKRKKETSNKDRNIEKNPTIK